FYIPVSHSKTSSYNAPAKNSTHNGFDGFTDVMRILLNEAMKIERDHALGAGPYERSAARKGHANGYKPKTVDTRMGRVTVDMPQVRGDVQLYPLTQAWKSIQ
ncbi:MAG: hypothetical protein GX298_08175, partial [Planctomycetes bacterium]|nr:hypothetical protein [Planctomycetota bacterium]